MAEPKRLIGVVLLLVCLAAPVAAWPASRDRDDDGLPDRWERRYHLSTTKASAKRDPDRDGLTNRREYRLRTNPRRADSDRDTLRDGAEVKRYRTNPRRADTDRDGSRDGDEVRAGTNPRDPASHPGPSAAPPGPAPTTAGPAPHPAPAATPIPIHCDRKATPSTIDAQLSAASAGQVICLATGDYGIWHGIDKAVTVRPAKPTRRRAWGSTSRPARPGSRSTAGARASRRPGACASIGTGQPQHRRRRQGHHDPEHRLQRRDQHRRRHRREHPARPQPPPRPQRPRVVRRRAPQLRRGHAFRSHRPELAVPRHERGRDPARTGDEDPQQRVRAHRPARRRGRRRPPHRRDPTGHRLQRRYRIRRSRATTSTTVSRRSARSTARVR